MAYQCGAGAWFIHLDHDQPTAAGCLNKSGWKRERMLRPSRVAADGVAAELQASGRRRRAGRGRERGARIGAGALSQPVVDAATGGNLECAAWMNKLVGCWRRPLAPGETGSGEAVRRRHERGRGSRRRVDPSQRLQATSGDREAFGPCDGANVAHHAANADRHLGSGEALIIPRITLTFNSLGCAANLR